MTNLEKNLNKEENICCFCKEPFTGFGNNAEPVVKNGICCDDCNNRFVIPIRLIESNK